MSSNSGNRKSMDDVLSSIRRIIGTERKDDAEEGAGPAPLKLGDPVAPGRPSGDDGGDALSLTPNMRVDPQRLRTAEAEAGAPRPLDLGGMEAPPRPAPPEPEPEPAPEPGTGTEGAEDEDAVVIDEAALEDMIRRIVREELAAAIEDDDESEGQMRALVRDELMGETGQNISRNVQAMIRSEVERMLRDRGL